MNTIQRNTIKHRSAEAYKILVGVGSHLRAAARRAARSTFFLFTLCALIGPLLISQALPRGSISGKVLDSQGRSIAGAQVKATLSTTGAVRYATTDRHGTFKFQAMEAGTYTVEISATSFKVASENGIAVKPGTDTSLGSVRLSAAQPTETAVIEVGPPLIETDLAAISLTAPGVVLTPSPSCLDTPLPNKSLSVVALAGLNYRVYVICDLGQAKKSTVDLKAQFNDLMMRLAEYRVIDRSPEVAAQLILAENPNRKDVGELLESVRHCRFKSRKLEPDDASGIRPADALEALRREHEKCIQRKSDLLHLRQVVSDLAQRKALNPKDGQTYLAFLGAYDLLGEDPIVPTVAGIYPAYDTLIKFTSELGREPQRILNQTSSSPKPRVWINEAGIAFGMLEAEPGAAVVVFEGDQSKYVGYKFTPATSIYPDDGSVYALRIQFGHPTLPDGVKEEDKSSAVQIIGKKGQLQAAQWQIALTKKRDFPAFEINISGRLERYLSAADIGSRDPAESTSVNIPLSTLKIQSGANEIGGWQRDFWKVIVALLLIVIVIALFILGKRRKGVKMNDESQGSKYHIYGGNFGAVGDQAEAKKFNQYSATDLQSLAAMIGSLKQAATSHPHSEQHQDSIRAISQAEEAANERNSVRMLEKLKAAGKWAADLAADTGKTVLAKIIEDQIGLK